MDKNDLLTLSKALEEAKPLGTRLPRKSLLRYSYIMLYLAYRAARVQRLDRCWDYLDLALPKSRGFGISDKLLEVYNHLGRQLGKELYAA